MNHIKNIPFMSKHHSLNALADHFFNGSIADFVGSDFINSHPAANVIETEKGFKIELAAPGLEKTDFNINLEKDQLKISVEKKKEEADENKKFTRREFAYTSFKRSFNLSDKVDKTGISATYEDGILNIAIPKKEASKTEIKKTIEIS